MIYLFVVCVGLTLGSFFNVLIYRLPRGESFILPPSHCPSCQHRLGFFDLFPVVSFLLLKGKCRYCKTGISVRYPLVEAFTGGMTLLWWVSFELSITSLLFLVLTYAIIIIALIDLDHQIIPNKLTIPMIVIGLVFHIWNGSILTGVLGGLVGGGILFMIAFLYPKGMGMGDVKYMTMVGVILGWQKALFNLFLGSFGGILIMLPLVFLKKLGRRDPFPFGPFLAFATLVIIYLENYLPDFIRFYIR